MSRNARRALALAAGCLVVAAGVAGWLLLRRADPGPALATPGEGVFTVYVLGESTAAGVPYEGRCDFGRIVARLFGGAIRGRRIEVVVLAAPGTTSAFARTCAAQIAAAAPPPDASVVLVYCGHNEFLKYDDRHDLSRQERDLIDRPLFSPKERALALEVYARTLTATLGILERARVPVILATQAANLADWEPNRSVLADPGNEASVRALVEDGERRAAEGDPAGALAAFEQVLAVEPEFAWAWKRAGDQLRALGRTAEARSAFLAAFEHDACPITAPPRVNRIVRELALAHRVPLVDAEEILVAEAPDGLPGWSLFWDNVHPNLAGYLAIAKGFARRIEELFGAEMAAPGLGPDQLAADLGIDAPFLVRVWTQSAQYCYGLAAVIWKPDQRLARARAYLGEAERLAPDDPEILCSQAVLRLFQGEPEESRAYWRRAEAADPEIARSRLTHPQVARLARRNGIQDPLELLLER